MSSHASSTRSSFDEVDTRDIKSSLCKNRRSFPMSTEVDNRRRKQSCSHMEQTLFKVRQGDDVLRETLTKDNIKLHSSLPESTNGLLGFCIAVIDHNTKAVLRGDLVYLIDTTASQAANVTDLRASKMALSYAQHGTRIRRLTRPPNAADASLHKLQEQTDRRATLAIWSLVSEFAKYVLESTKPTIEFSQTFYLGSIQSARISDESRSLELAHPRLCVGSLQRRGFDNNSRPFAVHFKMPTVKRCQATVHKSLRECS